MTQEEYKYFAKYTEIDFQDWLEDGDTILIYLTDGKIIEINGNYDVNFEENYLWIGGIDDNFMIPPSQIRYFKIKNKLSGKKEIKW